MPRPSSEIDQVQLATRAVLRSIDRLTDEQAWRPSLLPGWNRAEVITHLARNADGHRNMAEHARRGEVGFQYPGGAQQRQDGIVAGRKAHAAALRTDLRRAHDAMMESWNALPDDAWSRPGRAAREWTMSEHVFRRLLELEFHHVDLDLDATPLEWPVRFVGKALDAAIEQMPDRAAPDRPRIDAWIRIEATDHSRAWDIDLRSEPAEVRPASDKAVVDATVSGWGCDVLAWLYGRRSIGETVTISGELPYVARLPLWFPVA